VARFSAHVNIGLGAHPTSYIVGTGSFLGVKRLGLSVTTHPHLAPMEKQKSNSIPLLGFRGLFYGKFTQNISNVMYVHFRNIL